MYTFVEALSSAEKEIAFKLRYDVYCSEKGWLDASLYPDKLEKDDEDERSVIYVAFDKDNQPVGTTRLIVNETGNPLPISKHPLINGNIPTQRSVEISRFAIPESARKGDVHIGLIRVMFQHILRHYGDFDYLYFSVEQRFLDSLNMLGFDFRPLAPSALWYGDPLIPSRHFINTIDSNMKKRNPVFYNWLWQAYGKMDDNEKLISFLKAGKIFARKTTQTAVQELR
jgi:N-acyl-L-homoserine lactone synthetase